MKKYFCVFAGLIFGVLFSQACALPPAVIDFAYEVQQVPDATVDELFLAHISRPGIVVVKFGSQECSICRAYAPVFYEVAQKNPLVNGLDVAYVHVDVDLFDALRSAWQVYYYPTTILFKNGEEKNRVVGMQSQDLLANAVTKVAVS